MPDDEARVHSSAVAAGDKNFSGGVGSAKSIASLGPGGANQASKDWVAADGLRQTVLSP
jgi:hypothetical protein